MRIDGQSYQSIWLSADDWSVQVIDQTKLPYEFSIRTLRTRKDVEAAIKDMVVRGAPLIGVTAAFGICFQVREDASDAALAEAKASLFACRPTAVNLGWALERMQRELLKVEPAQREEKAYEVAKEILREDVETCRNIGITGLELIKEIYQRKQETVQILTHCNAGWLGCVDWGTALAPIYAAKDSGIPVHVWVDETRPRNQGAALTAFELGSHGIAHTVIVDNAGGHLMQHGKVDICIVGADRVSTHGDACNKIGTYLKALAAKDNDVPFYVALPCSTIDWNIADGVKEIPIEERAASEVTHVVGLYHDGSIQKVQVVPKKDTPVANFGFDVTPARLITGLITERGLFPASQSGLSRIAQHLPQNLQNTIAMSAGH